MDQTELQAIVAAKFPDAQVQAEGDGYHFVVKVVSQEFAGLSLVKRQQKVYACIADKIADGSLHAVTVKALLPEEA